uniref:Ubiquitin-like protein ATG12 n=1 Tax=Mycena chlorophos TaxID=658473 RepID=A0ABQ0LKD9_MYCCL|nr:APG12-domain-containing protein [Mycena chlorophos]
MPNGLGLFVGLSLEPLRLLWKPQIDADVNHPRHCGSIAKENHASRMVAPDSQTPRLLLPCPAPSSPQRYCMAFEPAQALSQAIVEPSLEALHALSASAKRDESKVIIQLKSIGNAPILKQTRFTISAAGARPFNAIIPSLRTKLGYKAQEPLFAYISNSFCPAPDENVGDLFKSFGADGQLIVNYSTTVAWG